MTTAEMVEAPAKPKRDIEVLIDKLKKIKKKPEDWVFVPRRKGHEKATVMLEDGQYSMVSDGSGGFKTHTTRRPVKVQVRKVIAIDEKGNLLGGFRPAPIGDPEDKESWTAKEVLDEMIALSLNPECEVVPYEAREMGKEAKDAQGELLTERRARLEAEEKLKALEDGDAKKTARLKELEDQVESLTKPGKK